MNRKKLEELCIRYLATLDVRTAATDAGIEGDPYVEGVRLLSSPAAARLLKRITDPKTAYIKALASLEKLAYGERGAVIDSALPDLFCVAEYKRTKDGGEVKYQSRLEAIRLLLELGEKGESRKSAESFFEALSSQKPSDTDD